MHLPTNAIFGKFFCSRHRAIYFYLFPVVVYKLGETFTANFKSKARKYYYLFGCDFRQVTIFQSGILLSALFERLLVFQFGIWAESYFQSKIYLNSESIVYRARCDFTNERYCLEMNDLFRMYFRFRNCSMVVQLFLNTVFRPLNVVFSVVDFLRVKAIFRFDFVKK